MKKNLMILLGSISVAVILLSSTLNYRIKMDSNICKDLVPNEETAIKIAEAIWLPIYGDNIYGLKPYVATSSDSIWIVRGTLPKGMRGGIPYIKIKKSDCKILKVSHGK